MRSKVGKLDAVRRANLGTLTARNTLVVVDNGKIILNDDCVRGAVILALFARNTSIFAILSCNCALILGITHNRNFRVTRDKLDDILRAFLGAHSATDADARIDTGNAVVEADGINGANACAVTAAYTSEAAGVGAAEKH